MVRAENIRKIKFAILFVAVKKKYGKSFQKLFLAYFSKTRLQFTQTDCCCCWSHDRFLFPKVKSFPLERADKMLRAFALICFLGKSSDLNLI